MRATRIFLRACLLAFGRALCRFTSTLPGPVGAYLTRKPESTEAVRRNGRVVPHGSFSRSVLLI